MNQQRVGRNQPVLQSGSASIDALVQSAQKFLLVPLWIARLAAALSDPLGDQHHLIDRRLAGQPHDVFHQRWPQFGFAFAGPSRKPLQEEPQHDVGPTFAHERQRAIEVEQHMTDLRPRRERRRKFDMSPAPRANGFRSGEGFGHGEIPALKEGASGQLMQNSNAANGGRVPSSRPVGSLAHRRRQTRQGWLTGRK